MRLRARRRFALPLSHGGLKVIRCRLFLRHSVPHGTKRPAVFLVSRKGKRAQAKPTFCGSFLYKRLSQKVLRLHVLSAKKEHERFFLLERENDVLFSVKRKEPKDLPRLPPRTLILRLKASSTRLSYDGFVCFCTLSVNRRASVNLRLTTFRPRGQGRCAPDDGERFRL